MPKLEATAAEQWGQAPLDERCPMRHSEVLRLRYGDETRPRLFNGL
jgi:hypothetical protein